MSPEEVTVAVALRGVRRVRKDSDAIECLRVAKEHGASYAELQEAWQRRASRKRNVQAYRRPKRVERGTDGFCGHTQKICYRSESDARAALAQLLRKRGTWGNVDRFEQRSYRCIHCRAWHLTSEAQRENGEL